MSSKKKKYKEKIVRRKEEKHDEPEVPKYRDRAKERREDQNPDYEPTELGSFHAVAPPGTADLRRNRVSDFCLQLLFVSQCSFQKSCKRAELVIRLLPFLRSADAHKISIERSKYLGGDVEHTHLVKGLDYALLHKVRSETDKKPEITGEGDGKARGLKEDQPLSFRTAMAKSVYQWIVNPQSVTKANEMFLPDRMAFIFNIEDKFSPDIPTTLHRSKDDCPIPQEMVSVSVDGSVLDRIAKIM